MEMADSILTVNINQGFGAFADSSMKFSRQQVLGALILLVVIALFAAVRFLI
jgi:hypothetical protein